MNPRTRTREGKHVAIGAMIVVACLGVGGISAGRVPGYTASWSLLAASSTQGPPHTLRIVIPSGPDAPAGDTSIHLEVEGRPPVRIVSTQPVRLALVNGALPIRFRYFTGLQLRTTVRSTDRDLRLPGLRTTRVTIHDSDGQGISGATLRASGSAGRFIWSAELIADAQGTVSLPFPASAAGSVAIAASADRFAFHHDEVDLAASRDLKIAMDAASAIRGTIVVRGNPSVGAVVQLWKLSGSDQTAPGFVVQREVAETFALDNLEAGDYELDFIVPKAGMQKIGPVGLKAGQEISVGEIDVSPSAALTGEVRDKTDKPVAGARVRLFRSGLPASAVPETSTNAAGRFGFQRLVPGEYYVELYSSSVGWQTFPDDLIVLQHDQSLTRSFGFTGTGCSVTLDIDGDLETGTATYALTLPITDGRVLIDVKGRSVQKHYPSVPCVGGAFVQRLNGNFPRHSVTLGAGEARFLVPTTARAMRDVRLLVGGQPFSGAALWAVPHDSKEIVHRSYDSNVTDTAGRAVMPMSADSGMILYISRGRLTLVVGEAEFSRRSGVLQIDLPDRQISGVARDESGAPVGGVSFGGTLRPARPGAGNPLTSAVTIFKGVTNPDGTFEAQGLAAGSWDFSFTKPSAQPALAFRTQIELPPSRTGTITIDTKLMPGR